MNSCIVDQFTGFYRVQYRLKRWLDSAWRPLSNVMFSGEMHFKPKMVGGDDFVMAAPLRPVMACLKTAQKHGFRDSTKFNMHNVWVGFHRVADEQEQLGNRIGMC